MDEVKTLREQARALRSLATPSETQIVRNDLLILAKRCEELAREIEREIKGQLSRPISGRASSALYFWVSTGAQLFAASPDLL